MTIILKYLKKHILVVLLIIALLGVQATADLALPDYTANIVNIGIQNSGIEDEMPIVIRESELNNLLLFAGEDKDMISNSYTLVESTDENIDIYPIIEIENIYELKSNCDIASLLNKPIFLYSAIAMDDGTIKNSILNNIPNGDSMSDMELIDILKLLPEETLTNMISQYEDQFNEMPEMFVDAAKTRYIKNEYETIGIDVDEIQSNYILKTGLNMVLIALLSLLASILVGLFGSKVASKLAYALRSDVFKKIVGFSNGEFKEFSTASLITRTTNDIQQIQNLTVMLLRIMFYAPLVGLGGFMKIFNTNASMSWVIGVAIAALLIIIAAVVIFVVPKFSLTQKLVDKLNLVTREGLMGIASVRAFSREKHEEKKFDKVNNDLTKVNIFVNRVMAFLMPMMFFIMNGTVILIVWVSAKQIDLGSLQIGDMLAFIQYAMQIIMSFLMIAMVFILLPRAIVSAKRIKEVLEKENAVKDPVKNKKFKKDMKGYVEFKEVSFGYPGAEENILEDINFIANPGETTAFIGSTGSGKSTLINLIPRFFDVTEGQILVEGTDIREVKQKDLRDKIGYVPQKGMLFSGTIESNVKYASPKLKDKELKKVLDIAQASEFVYSEKEGISRRISQSGINVSGGQKQRLSIARAIATNPDILIFDDSFSALDFKTDSKLRKAIKKELNDKTILIVAQRVSTIMNAEQIIVLDEGKIVGKGTHKELLKNCNVYKEIAESQLTGKELQS